jgi:hypothetical protein
MLFHAIQGGAKERALSYGRKETIGPLLKVVPYNTASAPKTGPFMRIKERI